jgi:hypothetical protein
MFLTKKRELKNQTWLIFLDQVDLILIYFQYQLIDVLNHLQFSQVVLLLLNVNVVSK